MLKKMTQDIPRLCAFALTVFCILAALPFEPLPALQ